MFIDRIRVKLTAGKGGVGRKSTSALKKADGGDGGNGGSVYLVGNSNYQDLSHLSSSKEYSAKDGEMGGKKQCHGENGEDLVIQVPLITNVYDQYGKKVSEIRNPGEKVKLLNGGLGGMGNYFFRTQFMGYEKTSLGKEGQTGEFTLELELFSDIIFIGLPNAGKSTIINELTNADAKIGAYAFTTINPQQGRMGEVTLLDLPGLIEETSKGKGLGTKFVKHTREAKIVAHMISYENEDVALAYNLMREELKEIGDGLDLKPEILILTKRDVVTPEVQKQTEKLMKKYCKNIISISVIENSDIAILEQFFIKSLDELVPRPEQGVEATE